MSVGHNCPFLVLIQFKNIQLLHDGLSVTLLVRYCYITGQFLHYKTVVTLLVGTHSHWETSLKLALCYATLQLHITCITGKSIS